MRKLRKAPTSAGRPARAAVVVPNGTLYADGVAASIRKELIQDFALHTVVRLPKGVFEPYTDIATNILFFERGTAVSHVWFYEHPLPSHRAHLKGKQYSATDGIQFSEFASLLSWWNNRSESDQAWRVSVEELAQVGYDLAQVHPKHGRVAVATPDDIRGTIQKLELEAREKLGELQRAVDALKSVVAPKVTLRSLLSLRRDAIQVADEETYMRPRVQLHFRGARIRDRVEGVGIGTKRQIVMRAGDLIVSRIDARHGAMAIVPSVLDGAIATNDFPVFEVDTEQITPAYLRYCLFQPGNLPIYESMSRGSTNRRRLIVDQFLSLTIPVPESTEEQDAIAASLHAAESLIGNLREIYGGMDEELGGMVSAAIHHVLKQQ